MRVTYSQLEPILKIEKELPLSNWTVRAFLVRKETSIVLDRIPQS